jgi:hypothetical protein
MPTGKLYLGDVLVSDPGSGAGDPWTPAQSSLALWLDASDASTISATGGLVDQWRDKSGNGRNFTGTTTTRPTTGASTQNGLNVLDFDGDYLTSASSAATWNFLHDSTGWSCFAVWQAGASSDPNAGLGLLGTSGTSSASRGAAIWYDDRASQSRNNGIVMQVVNAATGDPGRVIEYYIGSILTPNAFTLFDAMLRPSVSTAVDRGSFALNGGSRNTGNTFLNALSSSNATYTLQIGAAGNNIFPLVGKLAELIIVSGLESTHRIFIQDYLATKWWSTPSLPTRRPYQVTLAPAA